MSAVVTPTENKTVRARTHAWEAAHLHALAQCAVNSKGRQRNETECPLRTVFQRDRDRILHSKAFRRLKHKTQVFISPKGDHTRTRLTHTLEVSQVARTMARALQLNEDLTEAIALGHDLGHPPFGHSGEMILDELAKAHKLGRFRHELHSVRIVTKLAPLNLSHEVLNGIESQVSENAPETLEAQLVKLADRMTYLHHDMEDASRVGLIHETDVPAEITDVLGRTRQQRLDTLVMDLVDQTQTALDDNIAKIRLSPEINTAMMALRKWMFQQVYLSPSQQASHEKVRRVLTALFELYTHSPEHLPRDVTVLDHLAGMTDRYALTQYQELVLPTLDQRHHGGLAL